MSRGAIAAIAVAVLSCAGQSWGGEAGCGAAPPFRPAPSPYEIIRREFDLSKLWAMLDLPAKPRLDEGDKQEFGKYDIFACSDERTAQHSGSERLLHADGRP